MQIWRKQGNPPNSPSLELPHVKSSYKSYYLMFNPGQGWGDPRLLQTQSPKQVSMGHAWTPQASINSHKHPQQNMEGKSWFY